MSCPRWRSAAGAMMLSVSAWLAGPCLTLITGVGRAEGPATPAMKFGQVYQVAPGVFFRYSAISPTDPTVFGGSNNVWVVFEDYVAVIDANFPQGAAEVVAAIRKTTDKPIRYVLDTHHHGDHAYGNAVFFEAGATVVAQANCAHLLRTNGPDEFRDAGRGPTGRKDVAGSSLKQPTLVFDDKLVLDDGTQRVEFLFFGHAHTPGDAVAYLPRHKILCTGDACVNGAYNFMGHSDSASWIKVLEAMQHLDVKQICPGHGPVTGKDLLEKQKRYFAELRQHVRAGIEAGKEVDDIVPTIDMPWYKEWTTVEARKNVDNVRHVYGELTGRGPALDLVRDYGLREGPSPTKKDPGWTSPKRIVVPNLMPARLAELKRAAPAVEFVPVKTADEAVAAVDGADAVLGFDTPEVVKAGTKLRWIALGHGVTSADLSRELVDSHITLTDARRVSGPPVADQAFALLLALTRQLRPASGQEPQPRLELERKTLLVVGLGGAGTQVARRGHAFGMRVIGVDPKVTEKPAFVLGIEPPARLDEVLPTADVVVLTAPLTAKTRGMFGAEQFSKMRGTAILINVSSGSLVKTDALAAALTRKQIAGAGLDDTDPRPLPSDHPLRTETNVVLSSRVAEESGGARERMHRLWVENVRRFVAGEPLLGVVDKNEGF